MEEKEKKQNLAILGIVAIVAIVSLVVIFNQKSTIVPVVTQMPSVSAPEEKTLEEKSLVGQADYISEYEAAEEDLVGGALVTSTQVTTKTIPSVDLEIGAHLLKPAEESMVDLYVRTLKDDPQDSSKRIIEWCVSATADATGTVPTTAIKPPQAYHILMSANPSNPFVLTTMDGKPPVYAYRDPEAPLELGTLEGNDKLSSTSTLVTADFKTWRGMDGFCVKTKEPKSASFSQPMKLDVWTDLVKVKVGRTPSGTSAWLDYNLFVSNKGDPICSATVQVGAPGIFKCVIQQFRVPLSTSICTPHCGLRKCGDNGCGGKCGPDVGEGGCATGQQCKNGVCFTSGGAVTLTSSPASVILGSSVTSTWSGIKSPTDTDWIGVYAKDDPDNTNYKTYINTNGKESGIRRIRLRDVDFPELKTAGQSAQYELRLFPQDRYDPVLAKSIPFTITK